MGGCEVEEMRDDTVVNKCKNMFDNNTLKTSTFDLESKEDIGQASAMH